MAAERNIDNAGALAQTEHQAVQRVLADREAGDICRCHRPLSPPPGPHWWPQRDPQPGPEVRVVAIYGENPEFLRRVRLNGGWRTAGSGAAHPDCTPPGPWLRTGQCWAGADHPVVDVTDQGSLRPPRRLPAGSSVPSKSRRGTSPRTLSARGGSR